jgi:GNAT superfamily N-acetyltransferase
VVHSRINTKHSFHPVKQAAKPAFRQVFMQLPGLHGIYVDPSHHQQGIGSKLFRVVEAAVCKRGFDGLLLEAQQGANGFFISQEMQRLHVEDALHLYANCFWKSAASMVKITD